MLNNSEGAFDSWATRFGAIGVLQLLKDTKPADETILYTVILISSAVLWVSALVPLWAWKGRLVWGSGSINVIQAIGLFVMALLTTLIAFPYWAAWLNTEGRRGWIAFFGIIILLAIPVVIYAKRQRPSRRQ